jgi:hypothetical protein
MDNDTLMYMLALCLVWPVGWIVNQVLKNTCESGN